MFDHTHYVPILRWKMGEKGALKTLFQEDRARMTPLIEWSGPGEVSPVEDRLSPTPSPKTLARDILKCWGPRPFFCDLHWFLVGDLCGDSAELQRFTIELRAGGLRPIPVFGLGDGPDYLSAMSPLMSDRGVCLRLRYADLDGSDLSNRVNSFVSTISASWPAIDIVADFEMHYGEMDIDAVCTRVPQAAACRTLTVAAGSFPIDLRAFKNPGSYYQPREEWLRWKNQVSTALTRRPTFGDYATLHPRLTSSKGGLNPSASIRYATADRWLIMKGDGLHNEDGPGHKQYRANAMLLTERREYCGPDFSYGDRYISEVAGAETGTGTPMTWVRAGVNHHVTFVVREIAALFKTSGTPESSRPNAWRGTRPRRRGIASSID